VRTSVIIASEGIRGRRVVEDPYSRILSQYDQKVALYNELTSKVHRLVEEIMQEQIIRAHTVTSRVKQRDSLRKKITDPDKNYSNLSDLTDISGIRIITYFEDDVGRVSRILEREFAIDWPNTTDKRAALDPDRFGYLTMQHVAKLGSDRTNLLEYRRFSGLKFEVQTRSILQHAWAEIEHDLGYKNPESIPKEARRRFSRLASLMEICDEEFRSLRDELEHYRRSVPRQIQTNPQEVEIDKDSLRAFIADSPIVARIDATIASSYGVNIESWEVDKNWEVADPVKRLHTDTIEKNVQFLETFGVRTIRDLESELSRRELQIAAFAWEYTKPPREAGRLKGDVLQGVSVSNLVFVLAGRTRDVEQVRGFLRRKGLIDYEGFSIDEEARRIIEIYDSTSDQSS
jgi:putative GTP pyrophosphokinase